MTKIDLLEGLRAFTQEVYKDMILPCKPDPKDPTTERKVQVFLTHLPSTSAAQKFAPYVLHTLITAEDSQNEGEEERSFAVVRTMYCTYDTNEEKGGLALLALMERLRIELLKKRIIENRFELILQKPGRQDLIYPNDSAPFYLAETSSTWRLPAVEREVRYD